MITLTDLHSFVSLRNILRKIDLEVRTIGVTAKTWEGWVWVARYEGQYLIARLKDVQRVPESEGSVSLPADSDGTRVSSEDEGTELPEHLFVQPEN